MTSSSLLRLPAELVVRIIDFIHPSCHLSFALTCKLRHKFSEDILAYNRECSKKNTTCSDLFPLNVPKLIRTIFSDPVAAWQIRDLEFWGMRPSWDSWKTYDFDEHRGHWVCGDDNASGLGKSGKFHRSDELYSFGEVFHEMNPNFVDH